jgi:hypothetical protein
MKASSRTKIGLAIAGSVVVGILLGSTIFANMLSGTASGTQKQGLTISGTETIKVLGPDGLLLSKWQGADPVTAQTINAIASCVTGPNGGSTAPQGFGSCSGWISSVLIDFDNPSGTCTFATATPKADCTQLSSPATNYLTPQGCSPSGLTLECSGWITEAIFSPTSFTQGNCGTSCQVENVMVLASSSAYFDELCTNAYGYHGIGDTGVSCTLGNGAIPPVSPGDTLVVSIAFSIS